MQSHYYKLASWKCVDCDFVGGCKETMQVHSETLECSLCEYEAMSLENLETHLFTCKIYECGQCSLKGKSLKELKTILKANMQKKEIVSLGFQKFTISKWTEKTWLK